MDLDQIEVLGSGAQMQEEAVAPVTIRKAGDGNGTIIAGDLECGLDCAELVIPYEADGSMMVQAIPATGALFTDWENAAGDPIGSTFYANPGETVYGVFELK